MINCVSCGAAVPTNDPVIKYCDNCWREIQASFELPYTAKEAAELSAVDLISRDITHEILFNQKRRENYVYPIKPARLRQRRVDFWMQDYLNIQVPDLSDHDTEANNHINRVRGRNC